NLFYFYCLRFFFFIHYVSASLFISYYYYHHHIAFNTWAGRHIRHAKKTETGLAAYTIVFPSEEIRDDKIAGLKDIGVTVFEENGSFFTYDPSHTKICLIVD